MNVLLWWIFTTPGCTTHVPRETEAEARSHLVAQSYKGADVGTCVGFTHRPRESFVPR